MKIGIIVGSVRDERVGIQPGNWILDFARNRNDEGVSYELVDLKEYPLPFLGTTPTEEQKEIIQSWSNKMKEFDGYIFVTAEYNRAVPGAFKNALDYLYPEVNNKAVGYVGYGGLGGITAIENLRLINAEQEMASVKTMVTFSLMSDFIDMKEFKPNDYHEINANKMIDQVLLWSKALKTIR